MEVLMKEDVRFDENILQIMPSEIKKMLLLSSDGLSELYEIRFRINKPMIFITDKKELFIRKDGKFTNNIMEAYYIKNSDIKEFTFTIERGMYSEAVTKLLVQGGIITNEAEFNLFMENTGYEEKIQTGVYTVNSGMSYEEIAKIITKNK